VVANRSLLTDQEPEEVGGGVVDKVYLEKYDVTTAFPEREEAGTPNVVGAVFLASVLELLQRIGMTCIYEKEILLVNKLINSLSRISEVQLYGDVDVQHTPRTGIVAFNLQGLDHGLVTAILNDYHNVAVRNECFCAHPFVREMLKKELWELDIDVDREDVQRFIALKQGMVRASSGLYTTEADINALIVGIKDILNRRDYYQRIYEVEANGNYCHRSFSIPVKSLFDPRAILNKALLSCN
jgi:selenocysteine lyase/cysteine desulfurase